MGTVINALINTLTRVEENPNTTPRYDRTIGAWVAGAPAETYEFSIPLGCWIPKIDRTK